MKKKVCFDEKAHLSLLNDIKKLNKNTRIGTERIVRFTADSTQTIDKDEILKRIGDSTLVKNSKSQKSLPKPLEKPQAKRLKRAIGYEEVAIDAHKWGGIVNQRRKADQLKFPIEDVDLRVVTTEKNYKPPVKSDLEKEIYPLLYGAKLIENKKETEEDVAVKRAMSLGEVREKSKEIWKKKLLRQRLERKAALLNKSKSRKFHQILRRERLRKKKEDFENMKGSNPERALDILNEIEKSRVQERMDFRHRKSKWLHLQKDRASRDKNVMELLKENKEVCEEILQKFKDTQSANTEDSDDEFLINDATELSEEHKAHENMTEEEQREDYLRFQSDIEKLEKQASSKENNDQNKTEEVEQNLMKTASVTTRLLGPARIQDPSFFKGIHDYGSEDEDDEDISVGNFENIYQDEELIKEFQMEKQKKEEEKSKKLEDDGRLKGWGSWIGPGIQTKIAKRKRRILRTNPVMKPTNTYSVKPHIIYNEKSDVHKNIRKHMVSELPFPFARVKDFEASIRQPVGRTFVPEISHKKLIAPPILKKMGVVINPINEDSLLKNYDAQHKKISKIESELNERLSRGQGKRKFQKKKKSNNKYLSVKTFVVHK